MVFIQNEKYLCIIFPYPLWIVSWMVGDLLDGEYFLILEGLADNLDPGVKLPAHYYQVLRLGQGVDRTPSAKRTCLVRGPLTAKYF